MRLRIQVTVGRSNREYQRKNCFSFSDINHTMIANANSRSANAEDWVQPKDRDRKIAQLHDGK
jgi:hypothetical protein